MFGLILAHGLLAAVAMWGVWFVTHLPAVRVPPVVAGPLLLATLGLVLSWGVRGTGSRGPLIGAGAGLVAGLTNLLILGSKLTEQPTSLATAEDIGALRPGAPLLVAGFLLAAVAIGAAAGLVSKALPGRDRPDGFWLGRLALAAALAVAPLLFIGGLVTSTESGMAVPDWPGTYGANMFLYPVALMADERIFLEHTHRLFGSLVGLCTLALFISVCFARPAGRWRTIAIVVALVAAALGGLVAQQTGALATEALLPLLFMLGIGVATWLVVAFLRERLADAAGALGVLVALQGIAGGIRVTDNTLAYAIVHGVGGQAVFACAVLVAVLCSPGFKRTLDPSALTRSLGRRTRALCVAALACLLLQLAFGAMYRHMGSAHALWSHVLFAFVVLAVAGLAGAAATRDVARGSDPTVRTLRLSGVSVMALLGWQFLLGWGALAAVTIAPDRGPVPTATELGTAEAVPMLEALVATAHQASGAALLAAVTITAAWGHRVAALSARVEQHAAPPTTAEPA